MLMSRSCCCIMSVFIKNCDFVRVLDLHCSVGRYWIKTILKREVVFCRDMFQTICIIWVVIQGAHFFRVRQYFILFATYSNEWYWHCICRWNDLDVWFNCFMFHLWMFMLIVSYVLILIIMTWVCGRMVGTWDRRVPSSILSWGLRCRKLLNL